MRQELDGAVTDYLAFRASQGLAKGTLRNERGTLKRFLQVNGSIGVHKINGTHVTRYFEEAAKTCQPGSLGPAHATLNAFFKWARHTRRMDLDNDPMFGRRKPKVRKKERSRIHVSKFPALLDAAGERSPRDRMLVAGLLYTLLRANEMQAIRLRDVDLDAGYITAVISKSNIEDRVPISSELDAELRKWLTHYTERVGPLKPHYALVPQHVYQGVHDPVTKKFTTVRMENYDPESPAQVRSKMVHPAFEAIGFDTTDTREGCHTLRRSGARALYDTLSEARHPRPIRVVKDMLHHASELQTEVYIGVQADRLDRDEVIKGRAMYAQSGGTVVPFTRAQ